MTINERIKQLRKEILHKNQQEFASILQVTQSSISWSEQPGHNVPDSSIRSICSNFGISEKWLRTGEGEVYSDALPEDDLTRRAAELLGKHDPFFEALVLMYSELSEEGRQAFLKKGYELFDDAVRRQKEREKN